MKIYIRKHKKLKYMRNIIYYEYKEKERDNKVEGN